MLALASSWGCDPRKHGQYGHGWKRPGHHHGHWPGGGWHDDDDDDGGKDDGGKDDDDGGKDDDDDKNEDCVSVFEGVGDLGDLDDEFDDPSTLSCWFKNHEVEGTPPDFTDADIDESTPDSLTILPTPSGWFQDIDGPFFYKEIKGDFGFEVDVKIVSRDDASVPLSLDFSSAGILVRDAESSSPGNEDWVMFDVGRQRGFSGTEHKTTANSASQLFLEEDAIAGRLRVCRIGSAIVLAQRLDGATEFTEQRVFTRGDFGPHLQVGMCANAFGSSGLTPQPGDPDVRALWQHARFFPVTDASDCLVE